MLINILIGIVGLIILRLVIYLYNRFTYKKILYKSNDVKQLINTNNNILVVNVLTDIYYNNCHIENSINWSVKDILNNHLYIPSIKKFINYNTPLIVYCGHNNCNTSKFAYDYLVSKKFKNVYRYVGGMTEWYLSNNKSIGDCNIYEYVKCKTHDCYPPYPPMDI
jgi:rhodanese-related sulfurtransferase